MALSEKSGKKAAAVAGKATKKKHNNNMKNKNGKLKADPASVMPTHIGGSNVCSPEQKKKVLQFLWSVSHQLEAINSGTATVPSNTQLVVLGLIVPRDIRRLPSYKKIKKFGETLKGSNTPFLAIKGNKALNDVVGTERILGVAVSGVDDSLLQPILSIAEQQMEASEKTIQEDSHKGDGVASMPGLNSYEDKENVEMK